MEIAYFPEDLQRSIEVDIIAGQFDLGSTYSTKYFESKYNTDAKAVITVLRGIHRKGLIFQEENGEIRILGLPKAKITSVFQYAEKSQLNPSTIVRKVEIIPADEQIAGKLEIEPRSPLFVQVRTRKINREVLANQYNFIPYEICPGLEKIDLSQSSFQVALEKDFHTVITRIHEEYLLSAPLRDDKEILQISEKDQVLVVQRTSYSRNNLPVVFADIHVNPRQFHYVKDLWPDAYYLINKINKESQ
jgi:DNA-binding GntR family transcriptional regulator